MKNTQKYRAAFLLIFIFSLKMIIPVFTSFYFIEKATAEQQEEKASQEKGGEKSPNCEVETTSILNVEHNALCLFQKKSLTGNFQQLLLPVQYFAIPTPPPWC